ncbi:MAG: LysE family translocator [Muribaculaceae bacterium]
MNDIVYVVPRALAIGVLISAPMGPIGMLVIQRTLSKGRWPAFFTGLGAALSDLVYCLLSGLCLSFITDFINRNHFLLVIVGSVVLAGFGLYLFRKRPNHPMHTIDMQLSNNYFSDVISGFFLTFSNPLILFFIIGLFARFNFVQPDFSTYQDSVAYALIFAGALGWWYTVTTLVNHLRKRFNLRSLWILNRIIGSILLLMALIGIVMAIVDHTPAS